MSRLIVGLTGMSGAGKSTVCRAFAESGFDVIDCDLSVREVVQPGRPALTELHDRLSPELILQDGTLDRRKTAELIFHSEEKRALFNKIIYPYITYNIAEKLKSAGDYVLLEAPTLFEARLEFLCGSIVSVTADPENCVQRIMKRDGITEELAREIYSRAGLKGAPGRREKEAVSTWTVSWHMQPEAVLLAAERSAGYSHPFDRTRRLIEQLHEKGVTTLQQAKKAIEELEKQPAAEGGKKQQSSYFMNYGQRKYSDEDLKSIGITLLEDEEDKK